MSGSSGRRTRRPGCWPSPCPLCTPWWRTAASARDVVIETVAVEYLAPLEGGGGWTPWCWAALVHPLLEKVIGACHGPEVPSSTPGPRAPGRRRTACGSRTPWPGQAGSCRCFVSDWQEDFSRLASHLPGLGCPGGGAGGYQPILRGKPFTSEAPLGIIMCNLQLNVGQGRNNHGDNVIISIQESSPLRHRTMTPSSWSRRGLPGPDGDDGYT